jgi:filamentous hemagglutinin
MCIGAVGGVASGYVLAKLLGEDYTLSDAAADAASGAVGAGLASRLSRLGRAVDGVVTISRSRFPQAAAHIDDAQRAGHPSVLTLDRAGAAARRRDALKGTKARKSLDRDEYPPAMSLEGGRGSSVRHINPADNRGAGACVGAQCRALPDGARVQIQITPEG